MAKVDCGYVFANCKIRFSAADWKHLCFVNYWAEDVAVVGGGTSATMVLRIPAMGDKA